MSTSSDIRDKYKETAIFRGKSSPEKALQKAIEDLNRDIISKRLELIDEFAIAYLAETGLKSNEIEFVEDRSHPINISWYFRRRKKEKTTMKDYRLEDVDFGIFGIDPGKSSEEIAREDAMQASIPNDLSLFRQTIETHLSPKGFQAGIADELLKMSINSAMEVNEIYPNAKPYEKSVSWDIKMDEALDYRGWIDKIPGWILKILQGLAIAIIKHYLVSWEKSLNNPKEE